MTNEQLEADPFAALGLPARADITDDDVRSAWRRIAAATHPDRDDGGSPDRFAAAAAAYATLRTPFGRGEALADLADQAASPGQRRWRAPFRWRLDRRTTLGRWKPDRRGTPGRWKAPLSSLAGYFGYDGRVRPTWRWLSRLTVRLLAVAAVAAVASEAMGWSPGMVGVLAGAATWPAAFLLRGARARRSPINLGRK